MISNLLREATKTVEKWWNSLTDAERALHGEIAAKKYNGQASSANPLLWWRGTTYPSNLMQSNIRAIAEYYTNDILVGASSTSIVSPSDKPKCSFCRGSKYLRGGYECPQCNATGMAESLLTEVVYPTLADFFRKVGIVTQQILREPRLQKYLQKPVDGYSWALDNSTGASAVRSKHAEFVDGGNDPYRFNSGGYGSSCYCTDRGVYLLNTSKTDIPWVAVYSSAVRSPSGTEQKPKCSYCRGHKFMRGGYECPQCKATGVEEASDTLAARLIELTSMASVGAGPVKALGDIKFPRKPKKKRKI